MANGTIAKAYSAGKTDSFNCANSFGGQYYTDLTVTHGLGAIPSSVVVTPENGNTTPGSNVVNIEVKENTMTATSFAVRVWAYRNSDYYKLNWAVFR